MSHYGLCLNQIDQHGTNFGQINQYRSVFTLVTVIDIEIGHCGFKTVNLGSGSYLNEKISNLTFIFDLYFRPYF